MKHQVTQIMDQLYGGGGDYHTSYWPQPSFLSSRRFYIESTFQCTPLPLPPSPSLP